MLVCVLTADSLVCVLTADSHGVMGQLLVAAWRRRTAHTDSTADAMLCNAGQHQVEPCLCSAEWGMCSVDMLPFCASRSIAMLGRACPDTHMMFTYNQAAITVSTWRASCFGCVLCRLKCHWPLPCVCLAQCMCARGCDALQTYFCSLLCPIPARRLCSGTPQSHSLTLVVASCLVATVSSARACTGCMLAVGVEYSCLLCSLCSRFVHVFTVALPSGSCSACA